MKSNLPPDVWARFLVDHPTWWASSSGREYARRWRYEKRRELRLGVYAGATENPGTSRDPRNPTVT